MTTERAIRIAAAFTDDGVGSPTARLCKVCAVAIGVAGAGITIMQGGGAGPIGLSDTRLAPLDELQFARRRGPSAQAFQTGLPVHAPRLATSAARYWSPFVELARTLGIGAAFAYPLAVNSTAIGVLSLYQPAHGALTAGQQADSLSLASIVGETLAILQRSAPADMSGRELGDIAASRVEIRQASEMLAVHWEMPAHDALLRISAYAFAHDRPVNAVAADIVGRVLGLDNFTIGHARDWQYRDSSSGGGSSAPRGVDAAATRPSASPPCTRAPTGRRPRWRISRWTGY